VLPTVAAVALAITLVATVTVHVCAVVVNTEPPGVIRYTYVPATSGVTVKVPVPVKRPAAVGVIVRTDVPVPVAADLAVELAEI
jgi:hypothetical protein